LANPRIDDLRKKLDREPGSRLFAQLAEELRKEGHFDEAIRVARHGLDKHPNYPSARMTLGRALLDSGELSGARREFEAVLKGAPDNILASRYLAECLEGLGERDAAIARYKATLAMAPGEKHVVARLHELEGTSPAPAPVKLAPGPATGAFRAMPGLRPGTKTMPPGEQPRPVVPASRATIPPSPPPAAAPVSAPPAPVAAAPPPPIPLSTVEGEMELETSRGHEPAPPPPAAHSAAPVFAPIPLVAADEDFELERPYESPATGVGTRGETPTPTVAAPPPAAVPAAPEIEEQEFELEAPHEAPSIGWKPTIPPLPVVEDVPVRPSPPPPAAVAPPVAPASPAPVLAPAAPQAAPPPPAAAPAAPAPSGPATLTSPTLGELYFNQGFTDKAIEVYRELTSREPGNERLAARLSELEKLQRALGGEPATAPAPAAPPPAPDTPAPADAPPPASDGAAGDRRQAIERTIVRLEGLLSSIRKG
jgi:hypothetical protein